MEQFKSFQVLPYTQYTYTQNFGITLNKIVQENKNNFLNGRFHERFFLSGRILQAESEKNLYTFFTDRNNFDDSYQLVTHFSDLHCKPKTCKAYRELPVSQFSQGKPCFHYREPLFTLQGPCFHCRDFPVNPCTSLLGIAVW